MLTTVKSVFMFECGLQGPIKSGGSVSSLERTVTRVWNRDMVPLSPFNFILLVLSNCTLVTRQDARGHDHEDEFFIAFFLHDLQRPSQAMLADRKSHDTLVCSLLGETKIQRIQNHRMCKPSQQAACKKTQ